MRHDSPPHGARAHERAEDRAQFRRVREAFDDLRVEDQAVFLAEAAVGVVARGIEQAGHAVADALDELLRNRPPRPGQTAQEKAEDAAREATGTPPPPPEPPPAPDAT